MRAGNNAPRTIIVHTHMCMAPVHTCANDAVQWERNQTDIFVRFQAALHQGQSWHMGTEVRRTVATPPESRSGHI